MADFSIPITPRFLNIQPTHPDFAEIAAVAREDEAQFRDRAIAIVRQHVDHDRDAAGAVAFVGDFLERRARRFRRCPS